MGFLEETAAKAKEVFEAGEKKATEVINIQKLKMDISGLGSQINEAYCNIGKKVYTSDDRERYAEFAEELGKVDELNAKMEDLRNELAAAKGCTSCPECGCFCQKGAKFCSQCGNKF